MTPADLARMARVAAYWKAVEEKYGIVKMIFTRRDWTFPRDRVAAIAISDLIDEMPWRDQWRKPSWN